MSILNNDNYGVSVQNFIGSGNPKNYGNISSVVPADLPDDLNFIKTGEDIYVEYIQSVSNENNPRYATTLVRIGRGENSKLLVNNSQILINNVSSVKLELYLTNYTYIIVTYNNIDIYIRFKRIY
jgi:hypothetical protein